MKFRVQMTLDARKVGEPVDVEVSKAGPGYAQAAFGELANEIGARAEAMGITFPAQATVIGATIERL